jgi:phosphatidate cytidylyltransferase
MARPVHEPKSSELRLRVLSALVLAPIVLAAVYVGSPYFEAMLGIAGLLMLNEWGRICTHGRFGWAGYAMCVVAVVFAVAAWQRLFDVALAAILGGAVVVFWLARDDERTAAGWLAAGVIAVGVPLTAGVWLRADPGVGREPTLWLVLAVWVTDTAAFIVGRVVRGPRLAPTISPGKTWAGLVGAMTATAAWGFLWTLWQGEPALWVGACVGAAFAAIAQTGDLGVSVVKRRFGVKHSGTVIPGHGGVLDRFAGLLTTFTVAGIVALTKDGGLFAW